MDTISEDEDDDWNPLIRFHHSLKKVLSFVDATTRPKACPAGGDQNEVRSGVAKEDLVKSFTATPDEAGCQEFDKIVKSTANEFLTNKNKDPSSCPNRTHYHCLLHKEPDTGVADHYHCFRHEINEDTEAPISGLNGAFSPVSKTNQQNKSTLLSGQDEGNVECKRSNRIVDVCSPSEVSQKPRLCHLCSSPRIEQMNDSDSERGFRIPACKSNTTNTFRVPKCEDVDEFCDGNDSPSIESGASFISTYSYTTVPEKKPSKSFKVSDYPNAAFRPANISYNSCHAEPSFRSPNSINSSSYKSIEPTVETYGQYSPPSYSQSSYYSPCEAPYIVPSRSKPAVQKFEIRCIPIVDSEPTERVPKSPSFSSCKPRRASPMAHSSRTRSLSPSPIMSRPRRTSPCAEPFQTQTVIETNNNNVHTPNINQTCKTEMPFQRSHSPKHITYIISTNNTPRGRRKRRNIMKQSPRFEDECPTYQAPFEFRPTSPSASSSPCEYEYNSCNDKSPVKSKFAFSPCDNTLSTPRESHKSSENKCMKKQKKLKKKSCNYSYKPESKPCDFNQDIEFSDSEYEQISDKIFDKGIESKDIPSKSVKVNASENEREINIQADYPPIIRICCKHNEYCKCCNKQEEIPVCNESQEILEKKPDNVEVCNDNVNFERNFVCDDCLRKVCIYCGTLGSQEVNTKHCPLCNISLDIGRHQLKDCGSLCCRLCKKTNCIPVSTSIVRSETLNGKGNEMLAKNGYVNHYGNCNICSFCKKSMLCCCCHLNNDFCPCPKCTEFSQFAEREALTNIATCKVPFEKPHKYLCQCRKKVFPSSDENNHKVHKYPSTSSDEESNKLETCDKDDDFVNAPRLSFLDYPKDGDKPSCSSRLWQHFSPMLHILQNGKHCDVTSDVSIVFKGNEYPAHKIVLVTYSSYFRERLLKDSFDYQIDVSSLGVTKLGLEAALQWMYTADVALTPENIGHVWTSARCLGISMLKSYCKKYLRKLIKKDGKKALCKLIGDHRLNECEVIMCSETSGRKAASGTKDVLGRRSKSPTTMIKSSAQGFLDWPIEKVVAYLCKIGENTVQGQKEVFRMATAWLRHRWPERRCHVTRIMTCIRFAFLPRADVQETFKQPENQALWADRRFVSSVLLGYLSILGPSKVCEVFKQ